MKNISLIGFITAESPLTVSQPSVIGMPRNAHNMPYFPARSLRGWLRATGHLAVTQLFANHNRTLSVDEHYMLAKGVDTAQAVKGNTVGLELFAKNKDVRAANPFLSLFGRWGLAGSLSVHNAMPKNIDPDKVLVKVGAATRLHPFRRGGVIDAMKFIDPSEHDYFNDILVADSKTSEDSAEIKESIRILKKELRTADNDRKKEIFDLLAQHDKEIREIKDNRIGSTESIQRPIDAVEAIDEGVVMSHKIALKNPSDDEFQMLLWVLTKASADLSVGGYSAIGCGDISGEWSVFESSFDNPEKKLLGKITLDSTGYNFEGIDFDFKAFEQKILNTFDFSKVS